MAKKGAKPPEPPVEQTVTPATPEIVKAKRLVCDACGLSAPWPIVVNVREHRNECSNAVACRKRQATQKRRSA